MEYYKEHAVTRQTVYEYV